MILKGKGCFREGNRIILTKWRKRNAESERGRVPKMGGGNPKNGRGKPQIWEGETQKWEGEKPKLGGGKVPKMGERVKRYQKWEEEMQGSYTIKKKRGRGT